MRGSYGNKDSIDDFWSKMNTSPLAIDDYAKDSGKELFLRWNAFFNRIPVESLRIRYSNAC